MSYRHTEGTLYYNNLKILLGGIGVPLATLIRNNPVCCLEVGGGSELYAFAPPICEQLYTNEPGGFIGNEPELREMYALDLRQALADHPQVSVVRGDNHSFLGELRDAGIKPSLITRLRVHPETVSDENITATIRDALVTLQNGGVIVTSVDYLQSREGDKIDSGFLQAFMTLRTRPDCTATLVVPVEDYGTYMSSGGAFLLVKKC